MIILTTTYNCENFVERSLLTIMTQRFRDFKCYITDDMSTDNTVEIIKKTISGDDRFILIENKKKIPLDKFITLLKKERYAYVNKNDVIEICFIHL